MADRGGPFSNRDMPRHGNSGYGNQNAAGYRNNNVNSGYGYGSNYNNNSGYGNNNSGYENYDNFDRRGSMDVRRPQQQNAYRMRNNRGASNWQRGPVAQPMSSWRHDQGQPPEMTSRNSYRIPEYVQADVAGRRPYSGGSRPRTPELVNAYGAGARPKTPEMANSYAAGPRPKTPETPSSAYGAGRRPETPETPSAYGAGRRSEIWRNPNAYVAGPRPKTPETPNAFGSGRRPKTPETPSAYASGPRPRTPETPNAFASGPRPRTPELARTFSNSSQPRTVELASDPRRLSGRLKVSAPPVRVQAAYADVGVEADGLSSASIVGTCQDMCPAREREQRQRLRDLAIFERINGNVARTSPALAVKKFCRTISVAELQPSDVRPQPVLWGTLQYLMHMLDRREYSFESVHAFLFDRTRAVRQELGMQCIANSQAITMFEEIVRFHIMSERELREKNIATGNDADSQLNFQQLTKSLLTLLNLYGAVDAEGGSGWLHEAEFYSYYVLLNLGDRDHFKAEPLSLWFRRVRSSVLQAPDFVYARKVLRCYRNDNYKGFFDLAQKATYLQGCLMELYFGQMRSLALKAINTGGYKMNPYPVAEIASLLLMKQGDTEDLCKAHGLKTGIDKNHQLALMAKQAPFTPSTQIFRHQCTLISRKRAPTFFQEIVGEIGEVER